MTPAGLGDGGPFSFIVIGDTGEGDASQHVLRDSLLRAAAAPDVRFVVLSSDVVYPTGAMKDYESRFWLPFKGVTKPVYAIPGNHDWYDALEGFAATFFEPGAARAAIRARIAADGGRFQHHGGAHRGIHSAVRTSCAGSTASRPGLNTDRSFRSRLPISCCWPSIPECCAAWIPTS